MAEQMMGDESPVLVQTIPSKGTPGKSWGRLTLNLPRTLNSLSLEMIRILRATLDVWQTDPNILGVFLEGAGEKAFCAGGDITRIYRGIQSAKQEGQDVLPHAQEFFENEYSVDYQIHRFPKPFVVWGDGIVMGGGMGLMVGANTRIVTEKSLLAMPEITIGLYPDIGASYFLNQMPGKLGLFLGLSGFRMNAGDALYAGLADIFIPRDKKEEVWAALLNARIESDPTSAVQSALAPLAGSAPETRLKPKQAEIDRWMAGDSALEVQTNFLPQTFALEDKPFQDAQNALRRGSPSSAAITFELLKRAKGQTLEQAFQQELILSIQCCRHHDFPEGVRALLIDKDNNPQWQPATLDAVTPDHVAEHFRAPWDIHPLAQLGQKKG